MSSIKLNHIARETADVQRLAAFYHEVLGFEKIEAPNYTGFQVSWLRLPGSSDVAVHIIERDPEVVGPTAPKVVSPASVLPRSHHVAFSVDGSEYDEFVRRLKERGVEVFEKTQPDGKTRQVFFFDPDGNGLEVASREAS